MSVLRTLSLLAVLALYLPPASRAATCAALFAPEMVVARVTARLAESYGVMVVPSQNLAQDGTYDDRRRVLNLVSRHPLTQLQELHNLSYYVASFARFRSHPSPQSAAPLIQFQGNAPLYDIILGPNIDYLNMAMGAAALKSARFGLAIAKSKYAQYDPRATTYREAADQIASTMERYVAVYEQFLTSALSTVKSTDPNTYVNVRLLLAVDENEISYFVIRLQNGYLKHVDVAIPVDKPLDGLNKKVIASLERAIALNERFREEGPAVYSRSFALQYPKGLLRLEE